MQMEGNSSSSLEEEKRKAMEFEIKNTMGFGKPLKDQQVAKVPAFMHREVANLEKKDEDDFMVDGRSDFSDVEEDTIELDPDTDNDIEDITPVKSAEEKKAA